MTTDRAHFTSQRSIWRILGWGGLVALLALPAVAMQFTSEIQWDETDFIVMGVMLAALGGAVEFLARRLPTWLGRLGGLVAMFGLFFLVWVNLAVGIIGSEDNPANAMYAGVIAVAVGGACIAHFRPRGMAWAMLGTAAAQVAVGAIALTADLGTDGVAWPRDVIGATAILSTIWLAAGLLFTASAKSGT